MKTTELKSIMTTAWQFVKRNGYTMSEALKTAWANFKLKKEMSKRIVKFYFQKVDGTIREAWGSLQDKYLQDINKNDNRKKNDTVQVYFDSEKQAFRCFKKANLISIA